MKYYPKINERTGTSNESTISIYISGNALNLSPFARRPFSLRKTKILPTSARRTHLTFMTRSLHVTTKIITAHFAMALNYGISVVARIATHKTGMSSW